MSLKKDICVPWHEHCAGGYACRMNSFIGFQTKQHTPLTPMKSILSSGCLCAALLLCSCDKDRSEARVEAAQEKVAEKTGGDAQSQQFKGDWNVTKGKLKQKFGELTDDDLMYQKGKEDELYGRLEKKLGKTREEIAKLINGD
jgi:uncharacterized protein YjbJ (UPF0337 family)